MQAQVEPSPGKAPAPDAVAKETTMTKRAPRPRRSKSRSAIPTWPLAKQLLSDRSSFGDCEDIASAHLAGRLFTGREPDLSQSCQPTNGNYDHRRSFARPFEQPRTGWLLSATLADEQSRAVKGKSAHGPQAAQRIITLPLVLISTPCPLMTLLDGRWLCNYNRASLCRIGSANRRFN